MTEATVKIKVVDEATLEALVTEQKRTNELLEALLSLCQANADQSKLLSDISQMRNSIAITAACIEGMTQC